MKRNISTLAAETGMDKAWSADIESLAVRKEHD
jgi:hypothetical protein